MLAEFLRISGFLRPLIRYFDQIITFKLFCYDFATQHIIRYIIQSYGNSTVGRNCTTTCTCCVSDFDFCNFGFAQYCAGAVVNYNRLSDLEVSLFNSRVNLFSVGSTIWIEPEVDFPVVNFSTTVISTVVTPGDEGTIL